MASTAGPQPVSAEQKLKEMDSVPLFMRSLPEDGGDDVAISALQSLAHEGTPDEVAENFKDQGNNYFKGKRYREARDFYTQGIDAKPDDRTILEALLCNRAACNLEFKNYGSVLRDCSRAITLNPRSSKAHYRSAVALIALERYDEAVDVCTRCLQFDPDNAAVQQVRDRAQVKQEAKEKKEKERQEHLRREAEAKRELQQALKAHNIIQINDPNAESSPYEAHLEKEDPSSPASLVLPVFFLYPQHATSDLISQFQEDVPFSTHLWEMFPSSTADTEHPPPEWDTNREYLASSLVVYAITHTKRLLKVGKKMTLRELCEASKGKDGAKDGLEMKNGCLSVVVLPKGDVEKKWVDNFKAMR